jgi:hypothetical protein
MAFLAVFRRNAQRIERMTAAPDGSQHPRQGATRRGGLVARRPHATPPRKLVWPLRSGRTTYSSFALDRTGLSDFAQILAVELTLSFRLERGMLNLVSNEIISVSVLVQGG